MTLDELLELWQARQEAAGLRERTIEERASLVRRFQTFAGGDPAAPSAAKMTLFLGRPGLKPRTRWIYRQHLSAWCDFLLAAKIASSSPMEDVPAVRKPSSGDPRPLEPYQLEALLARVDGPARMMVLLAAFAGLRVHEIAKIEGRDLDRIGGILTVEGKGGKEARIPAHPAIVEEAAAYPETGFWFPAKEGGHLSRQAISRTISQALAAAGVHASAHQLRHTFGTSLLASGSDVRVVQELMRHASLQTTQIYTRVSAEQRTAAIERLALPAGRRGD